MKENLTYNYLLQKSWPIILANAAGPLLGLVDTAVIGNFGTVSDLAAIAFGSLLFSFVYWGFGFLRMATTGYVAKAIGAKDEVELRAILGRSLLLGLVLSLCLMIFQRPLASLGFSVLYISPEVLELLKGYLFTRIWGAPAILLSFTISGFFIGYGDSRRILKLQLLLNTLNMGLDLYFAGYLGMGIKGIALGTLIAEIVTCLYGLYALMQVLKSRSENAQLSWPWERIKDWSSFLETIKAKINILIRTLILIFGFAHFTNQSSHFGDTLLGANHILLQLLTFSAFFLDAYAYVVESLVGKAIGAKDNLALKIAVNKSSVLAGCTALALSVGIYLFGPYIISFLTDLESVREKASESLILSSLYVFLAFPAFQLDGIFIGAGLTRQMRDASLISISVFLLATWGLVSPFGIAGLWSAFIIFVCARALALGLFYKDLNRTI